MLVQIVDAPKQGYAMLDIQALKERPSNQACHE